MVNSEKCLWHANHMTVTVLFTEDSFVRNDYASQLQEGTYNIVTEVNMEQKVIALIFNQ